MSGIHARLEEIRRRMAAAAERAGRAPDEILLLGASKMHDAAAVREAIAAGVDALGENRVQEMREKWNQNAYDGVPLHFIGHLQRNKVRQVIGVAVLIQSVDSLSLLEEIDRVAARQGLVQDVLLEVNIGGEESKSGFSLAALDGALSAAETLEHVHIRGLMTIPPPAGPRGSNRMYFDRMQQVFVDISKRTYHNSTMQYLSMGMSDDFEDAIAAGSNLIRVGAALFGPRPYQLTRPQEST